MTDYSTLRIARALRHRHVPTAIYSYDVVKIRAQSLDPLKSRRSGPEPRTNAVYAFCDTRMRRSER
ncbi:MAG: hypothetical protein AAFO75_14285 [Pseudomonadota bacterium]